MTEIELNHAHMVMNLAKPGEDIMTGLNPVKVDMMHAAVGISGEAGELLDAIKKHVIYNKPLDFMNVVEELGDLEFYLAQLRFNLGIGRSETLKHNMDKLEKRYGGSYSDAAAQARADKEEGK